MEGWERRVRKRLEGIGKGEKDKKGKRGMEGRERKVTKGLEGIGKGEIPDDWKKAIIVPLYKGKGSRSECRSLRNKIDLLRGKVCVENFDITAVTETWIDTNSKNFLSEFKIEGYELIHEDRKGRRGAGSLFMLKTHSASLLTIQSERTLTQSHFG